jgi:hypothetical protein
MWIGDGYQLPYAESVQVPFVGQSTLFVCWLFMQNWQACDELAASSVCLQATAGEPLDALSVTLPAAAAAAGAEA